MELRTHHDDRRHGRDLSDPVDTQPGDGPAEESLSPCQQNRERRQEITKRMRELTSDSKIDMKSHEEKKEWKNDVYSYFAGEVTEIKTENKLYGYSAIDKLHKRIQQQNTSSSDKN